MGSRFRPVYDRTWHPLKRFLRQQANRRVETTTGPGGSTTASLFRPEYFSGRAVGRTDATSDLGFQCYRNNDHEITRACFRPFAPRHKLKIEIPSTKLLEEAQRIDFIFVILRVASWMIFGGQSLCSALDVGLTISTPTGSADPAARR